MPHIAGCDKNENILIQPLPKYTRKLKSKTLCGLDERKISNDGDPASRGKHLPAQTKVLEELAVP